MNSATFRLRRKFARGLAAVWFVIIGAVLLLNVLVVVILLVRPTGPSGTTNKPPAEPWSAVLLTDNEVFFGHIKTLTTDRIELTNVYFVQKPSQASGATPLSIVSLVANQVQCPQDEISIDRTNVLYWENLQDRSFVVQRLNQLQTAPQNCYQPPSPSPTPSL